MMSKGVDELFSLLQYYQDFNQKLHINEFDELCGLIVSGALSQESLNACLSDK